MKRIKKLLKNNNMKKKSNNLYKHHHQKLRKKSKKKSKRKKNSTFMLIKTSSSKDTSQRETGWAQINLDSLSSPKMANLPGRPLLKADKQKIAALSLSKLMYE